MLEDVFSSSSSGTGFRIRAAQGRAADHGLSDHGFASWAERVAATLFFTLFPADCRICGSPLIKVSRLPVCETCLIALTPLQGSYCTVCGEALHVPAYFDRLAADRGETERLEADRIEVETRCLLCQRTDPPFERAVAYGSYDGELRDLIHLLKFQQVSSRGGGSGTHAGRDYCQPGTGDACWNALLQQNHGYPRSPAHAQASTARIQPGGDDRAGRAEATVAPEKIRSMPGSLVARREVGSQIGLTRHQRRENMRGAFAVSDPTRILNRDILLIDDVYTTGTTASECARVLRRAGAVRVWLATVARTLKLKVSDVITVPENISEQGVKIASA